MFQIFITVVIAVLVGGLLLKYWEKILGIISAILAIVFLVAVYIIELPFKLIAACIPRTNLETKLVRMYDYLLSVESNIKSVRKMHKKIEQYEKYLREQKQEEKYKEGVKLLKEAKWVI